MFYEVCLVWFACPVNKQPDSRQTALRGSLLGGPREGGGNSWFSFLFHTQVGALSKLSELCLDRKVSQMQIWVHSDWNYI